jgi:hypothetical protein
VLLVFQSVHQLLRAEKVLLAHSQRIRIISLPPEVSNDCVMGIDTEAADAPEILKSEGIPCELVRIGEEQ